MKRNMFVFATMFVAALAFTSCGDDKPGGGGDDPDNGGGKIENVGGTLTYMDESFELTDACQHNEGKTYNDQEFPRNYINLYLYKKVLVEHEGSTYYDTLHYINVGMFCNEDMLTAGTYNFEMTAGQYTWLNSHVWAFYGFGYNAQPRGEVFQESGVFTGDVVMEKKGDNYKVKIDWTDQNGKKLTASYYGPIPTGVTPLIDR
ncbi:MAG: hypothetical protein II945_05775 [Bacteroidales bacterium]|nr:hypothetical protein [Bacteroidales bacterium]